MTNIYTRLSDAINEFIEEEGSIEQLLVVADVDNIMQLSQMCDDLLDLVEEKYGGDDDTLI